MRRRRILNLVHRKRRIVLSYKFRQLCIFICCINCLLKVTFLRKFSKLLVYSCSFSCRLIPLKLLQKYDHAISVSLTLIVSRYSILLLLFPILLQGSHEKLQVYCVSNATCVDIVSTKLIRYMTQNTHNIKFVTHFTYPFIVQ